METPSGWRAVQNWHVLSAHLPRRGATPRAARRAIDRNPAPLVKRSMRSFRACLTLLGLTIASACGSSYADTPPAGSRYVTGPVERSAPPSYSPYRVEVLGA